MIDKFLHLLGIAMGAGKVKYGLDVCVSALLSGKAELAIISNDMSQRSASKLSSACEKCGKQCIKLDITSDELWFALGKKAGVFAVTDKGFSDRLNDIYSELTSK